MRVGFVEGVLVVMVFRFVFNVFFLIFVVLFGGGFGTILPLTFT